MLAGCNPQMQALARALAESPEEWRERVAQGLDRIPPARLAVIIEGYMA